VFQLLQPGTGFGATHHYPKSRLFPFCGVHDWIVMRNIASPLSGCYDFLFD